MLPDKNQQVFFELLKAGLWGGQRPIQEFKSLIVQDSVDWEKVYQLAQEQSVQGIVLSGLEELRAKNVELNVPKVLLLQWIGEVQMIEQRSKEMNAFIAELIKKLRKNDINAILVKGQGIAQCYEKPLWRTSGDVDLLLSDSNYEKAKGVLLPLATNVEQEFTHVKHLGMTIDGFVVELHGTQHSRLSKRVDDGIDATQREMFNIGKVRVVGFKSPGGSEVQVFLPAPDEDVIFVFTHILHHFFLEGVGLRQICDWCRLLWTCKDSLNRELLESRIRKMGLMTEWKAFGALAIVYLGFPRDSMPLLNSLNVQELKKLKRKADKICEFVLEVGNFGHKQRRDYGGMSYLRRKFVSVIGRLSDMLRHFRIFPLDSIRFFGGVLRSGLYAAVRGE